MKFVEDRLYAEQLLNEAAISNPGTWVQHSINVARAAEYIAIDLLHAIDPNIAYTSGLLHDIGRYIGVTPSVIHSLDGYLFMIHKGFEGTANVCVTHSFPSTNLEAINGWGEIPSHVQIELSEILNQIEWTIYDKLITICDALADDKGFSTIEKRIVSAAIRNGINSKSPILWKGYFIIKQEIEKIIHKSIYRLLPNIEESIYTDIALIGTVSPTNNQT
ncbi:HD domain-containing protein [Paenibacillus sp. GCM10027626]|uniref:HD domain-containing protein n=1 Tax=Paenibacillus sp. GCM10027626 TaxID=3273411 RepID=UPI0036439507